MASVTSDETSFANKSWVELCEEKYSEETPESEKRVESDLSKEKTTDKNGEGDVRYKALLNSKDSKRKIDVKKAYDSDDEDGLITIDVWPDEDSRMCLDESPAKCKTTPPKNFVTYANALKSVSPNAGNGSAKFAKNDVNDFESDNKRNVKRDIQREFLQDDLSLTSHLDVFHMQSPCKQDTDTNSEAATWKKNINSFPKLNECTGSAKKNWPSLSIKDNASDGSEVERRNGKRRLPLMQVDAERPSSQRKSDKIPDEILMPSPSKIIRGFCNAENTKSPRNYVESRKRQRESYSSPSHRRQQSNFLSPSNRRRDSSYSSPSNTSYSDVEYETDPTILARRQKQIDYGKNTVGYERYTTEVARDKREKNHPKTPPRHLKFSRRAWDGLVKNWRRRLHYWDPQSEGCGNPKFLEDTADLNDSELSELSGCESVSLPSTPQQDWKRRKAKPSGGSLDEEYNEDYYINDKKCFDDEDCKPLDIV